MDQLRFETVAADQVAGLETFSQTIQRASVPGGWIVVYDEGRRVKFCPSSRAAQDSPSSLPASTESLHVVA